MLFAEKNYGRKLERIRLLEAGLWSSLSTSLRSAYAKILLDFDIYEEEEQAARNNEKMKTWWNLEIFRHSNSRSRDEENHFIKKLKYTAIITKKVLAVFTAIVAKFGSSYPDLFAEHNITSKEFERLYFHLLSEHFIDFEIDTGLGLPLFHEITRETTRPMKSLPLQYSRPVEFRQHSSSMNYRFYNTLIWIRPILRETTYDIGMLFSCQGLVCFGSFYLN
nr:BPK_HP1_G0042940.mRNA.1.CDS.1 [Saccharomyces cerevisiae]